MHNRDPRTTQKGLLSLLGTSTEFLSQMDNRISAGVAGRIVLGCMMTLIFTSSLEAESFTDYGFSVEIPVSWQVLTRPTASDTTLKIYKRVSSDLSDVCLVHVHDHPSDGRTQDEIDDAQRRQFRGPVPDYSQIEAEKRRLENAYGKDGPPVKIEALSLDKLGGHPSEYYTYTRDIGELKQFAYVNALITPTRNFTILCQATSHDIDAARMEFGQKLYAEIVPFIASFVLK